MITARGEVRWHRWKVGERADLQDQVHSYHDVEQEVTVEQPESWIVGTESQYDVTIVRDGNGVLERWQIVLPVEQTAPIEIERVLQVDLLDVRVR